MPAVLTTEMVEQFERDGFCTPFRVLDEAAARAARERLQAFETANGGPLRGSHRFKSHLLFKWQSDLVRHPLILDAIEDLIGPDILCWTSNWWIKEPGSPSFVSWHQDSQYWGLDTTRLVTAWLALSPATVESGCMRVLPGSHRGADLPHQDTWDEDNMLTRGQAITEGVDESRAVNLEVATGEVALFAYRIAHASHPNLSADRRIALAIRYVPPDTRQPASDWDSASLVRGQDHCGHFEHEPEPTCDFDPVATEFHARAEENQRAILYRGTTWKSHRT
jgi:hypothetical protein